MCIWWLHTSIVVDKKAGEEEEKLVRSDSFPCPTSSVVRPAAVAWFLVCVRGRRAWLVLMHVIFALMSPSLVSLDPPQRVGGTPKAAGGPKILVPGLPVGAFWGDDSIGPDVGRSGGKSGEKSAQKPVTPSKVASVA